MFFECLARSPSVCLCHRCSPPPPQVSKNLSMWGTLGGGTRSSWRAHWGLESGGESPARCHVFVFLCSVWTQALGKYQRVEKETDMLLSTLSAMQDKAQHLECNLSAETRIKLDLFSVLGDTRRQLEIAQGSSVSLLCSASNCFNCFVGFFLFLFCYRNISTMNKQIFLKYNH